MGLGKIITTAKRAIGLFFRTPGLVIGGTVLWVILEMASLISSRATMLFQNTFELTAQVVVFGLVLFAVLSVFFSGFIGMTSASARGGRGGWKEFWGAVRKNWLVVFLLLIVVRIISIGVFWLVFLSAFWLSKFAHLSVGAAGAVFTGIYFVGLFVIMIFLTFPVVMAVVKGAGVWKSIKYSIGFVKKNYLETLSVSVIFFVLYQLLERASPFIGSFVEYVILVPVYVLVLVVLAESGERASPEKSVKRRGRRPKRR